jgi:probable S-adenosylmethionine-dependent methyltransferase, YraL family
MLYITATPIGNLGDLTPRALDALKTCAVIVCEDTRRTWALLSSFGIPRPSELLSYREGNEERAGERVLAYLEQGADVALCTDGGYPGISDPGYRLVRDAIARGLDLCVLPGASAVNIALVASGLPTASWTFKGFPPRKPGALRRFFADEAEMPHTMILFESPYRIAPTLAAASEVLGARNCALCLELTKVHEKIIRGTLSEVSAIAAARPIKGEATIVIEGKTRRLSALADNGASGAAGAFDDADTGESDED